MNLTDIIFSSGITSSGFLLGVLIVLIIFFLFYFYPRLNRLVDLEKERDDIINKTKQIDEVLQKEDELINNIINIKKEYDVIIKNIHEYIIIQDNNTESLDFIIENLTVIRDILTQIPLILTGDINDANKVVTEAILRINSPKSIKKKSRINNFIDKENFDDPEE